MFARLEQCVSLDIGLYHRYIPAATEVRLKRNAMMIDSESLSNEWAASLILCAGALEHDKHMLGRIILQHDVALKQTAQVQRFGGEATERGAIVVANLEHWPEAVNYPHWERRAKIERIEALCCAALSAWDWIVNARNNIHADKHIGTMEMLKAARTIGCCEYPNIQRTSERMRCAGYHRASLGLEDALWKNPERYPIDAYEDRPMCVVCSYPIGSWEESKFATVNIHENCVHYLKKVGVDNG
jgi:hypothetical protein